jgi:hypothetical protein
MSDFKKLLDQQISKVTSKTQGSTVAPQPHKPVNKKVSEEPREKPQYKAVAVDPVIEDEPVQEIAVIPKENNTRGQGTQSRNINRVTVNLFDADSRALSVIKELLGSAGHDFTSRSDSIKIGLRLAAKAKPEELADLYGQVKADDGRFAK